MSSPRFVPDTSSRGGTLALDLARLRLLVRRQVARLRAWWGADALSGFQGLVISDERADALLGGPDIHANGGPADDDARRIEDDLRALESEITIRRHAHAAAGEPLDVLARRFGLGAFERDVVLLCFAPELDPTLERLYAYMQDDVTRRYPTPHLAQMLFGADLAAMAAFAAGAPLRRFRLLRLEDGNGAAFGRALRLDDRVREFLLDRHEVDGRVAAHLAPSPPALLAESHVPLAAAIASRLADGSDRGARRVSLIGPRGAGKLALARAVADRLGIALWTWKGTAPAAGPDREEWLRLVDREACLAPFALYVEQPPARGDDDPARDVSGIEALVFSGQTHPAMSLDAEDALLVEVPKPPAGERAVLWAAALGADVPARAELDALVQQFDFGPRRIAQVVAAARARQTKPSDPVSFDDLWQSCRAAGADALSRLARRISASHRWDDLVVPDDVAEQLREIGAQVALRPLVYEMWGFGSRLGRGRGISALFSGASGVGKTMGAEVLADRLRLDLYRIDLASVVSKYIGETEKNLQRVFDAAEDTGAILFFDEADALFGKRTEVKDAHDRYANIEVDYLLQRMEDYRGLSILATNLKSHLDPAFLRRLRFIVDFPFPDAALRARIWQKAFPADAPIADLDWSRLSRLEIAGGNIRNIAVAAAFLAAERETPIAMPHVLHAARREYAKIDKLLPEAELQMAGGRR